MGIAIMFIKLHKIVKNVFLFCRELVAGAKQSAYTIEEINTQTEDVVIRIRGTRTCIKTTIEYSIGMPDLIEGLTPLHACWLGYYFGNPPSTTVKRKNVERTLGFKLQCKRGRFKIVTYDLETQVLTYLDSKINKTYEEKITQVVQDSFVIKNIDSTQACYIGMQAGFEVRKQGNQLFHNRTSPILKLVK